MFIIAVYGIHSRSVFFSLKITVTNVVFFSVCMFVCMNCDYSSFFGFNSHYDCKLLYGSTVPSMNVHGYTSLCMWRFFEYKLVIINLEQSNTTDINIRNNNNFNVY